MRCPCASSSCFSVLPERCFCFFLLSVSLFCFFPNAPQKGSRFKVGVQGSRKVTRTRCKASAKRAQSVRKACAKRPQSVRKASAKRPQSVRKFQGECRGVSGSVAHGPGRGGGVSAFGLVAPIRFFLLSLSLSPGVAFCFRP